MTEQCGCGAVINTLFYSRVRRWHREHRHDPTGTETVETQTTIGFAPNPNPDSNEDEDA